MKLLPHYIRGRGKNPSCCLLLSCIFLLKAESIDYGTGAGSLRRAVIGEPDEGSPHGLQRGDFGIKRRDPNARQILRSCPVASIQSEQRSNLVKCEPGGLR